jgi:hypothetical protein
MDLAIASVLVGQAQQQQAVSLSLIKQQAQEGQAIAAILDQSAQIVAAANGRGTIVDTYA